ncbi:MAG: hypothetical protein HZB55_08380 [Deltaproteobacteria bacterium]|nr:hypothetical protein [Deltaproteobacteria bacterium]
MTTSEFLRPRLCGARFEGHAIPLEVLKDLAVLEEMVTEIAKWKFLQEHPGRARSPRGFTEGIELKLTSVEPGSAVPVISLVLATLHLPGMPPSNQIYFEQARDAMVCAIAAAEQNQPIIEHLPEKALSYFDRMGRSLRDGEAIEFVTASHPTPARLNRETRRKLVLASPRVRELTEEATIRGAVPEADQDDMTFEVQLIDGHKVKAPMPDQFLDVIIDAFNGYKNGARIVLQGIGKYSRQNRLLGFESIEHISLLDPLDVPARLDEMRQLRNGWLEGKGMAPDHKGLDWLARCFDLHFPEDIPLPHMYPTTEGGVQSEWSLGTNEVSLDVDLGTHRGEWHRLNLSTDAEDSRSLNLELEADWTWLGEQIRRLAGGEA